MAKKPEPPASLGKNVERIGGPVSPAEVDSYAKLQDVRDQSHRLRTIVKAWKDQQVQERKMRERYANLLIWGMGIQVVFVNVIVVLIGCKLLMFEPWTAQTFIVSVFAEITALVLVVVKYLFRGPDGSILESEARPKRRRRDEQH
jgi:hypothetical protein